MTNQEFTLEQLSERLYAVREQRNWYREFVTGLTGEPISPWHGHARASGMAWRAAIDAQIARLIDLLRDASPHCPPALKQIVDDTIMSRDEFPIQMDGAVLVESLRAIADPEHCATRHTVDGLRRIARHVLERIALADRGTTGS